MSDRWKRREKLVLVFDEFQWTARASPELPSVLQDLWDRRWRSSGRILLIVCGSHVGFMEREVLGRKSPLFGRRTAQILLRPFGYREAALFHPSYSPVDRARAYFICGGVPWYLGRFHTRRSIHAGTPDSRPPRLYPDREQSRLSGGARQVSYRHLTLNERPPAV